MSEATEEIEIGRRRSVSTWFFVLGALVGMVVSVDTSWRFFAERVGVTNVAERVAMFSGVEILLIGCGWAMFEGVRGPRRAPGRARWLAWALCGASAYAALTLSGWPIGPARVLFGPVLSVVALHFALGIEMRASGHQRSGTLARVGRELRERLLSRLGLADDGRDALTRTQARAARRAAHLARAKWAPFRQARLGRALRAANVAHDAAQRQRMLAELQAIEHAAALRNLRQASPWQAATLVPAEAAAAAMPAAQAAGVPGTAAELPRQRQAERQPLPAAAAGPVAVPGAATAAATPAAEPSPAETETAVAETAAAPTGAAVATATATVPVATATSAAEPVATATAAATDAAMPAATVPETAAATVPVAELKRQAREHCRQSAADGQPVSGKQLGEMFGRSERWGRAQIAAAKTESGNVVQLSAGGNRRG